MSKHSQKEIFTAIGHVEMFENRHRFIPNSSKYLSDQLSHVPLHTEISCTFSEHVMTRSEAQLAYYWVIIGYLARHSGYRDKELHDGVMRILFGTKIIDIAGEKVEVRKSVSDSAHIPKYEMVRLIEYVLQASVKLNVRLPTQEELGYTSNKVITIVKKEEFYKGLEVPKGKPTF